MAQTTPGDSADPVSNAIVSPQASLFIRQILEAALDSPRAGGADWVPEAQALLANVMMNDYLNWWNLDCPVDPDEAQKYVTAAMGPPLRPDPVLALVYHAQALIYRAQRNHDDALCSFQQAAQLDDGFARAHAQIGNQYVRLGQEANSYPCFQRARIRAPNHPALGYFDWGEGRAYFQQLYWDLAIGLLERSVKRLPTVWYNRCFLAAAQDAAGHHQEAQDTITAFVDDPQFTGTFPLIKALPEPIPNTTVGAAWQRVLSLVKPHLP